MLTKMAAEDETGSADGRANRTRRSAVLRQLKGATVAAYYTSKIGIHVDQHYKGNVYQPGEYAGICRRTQCE